MQSLMGDVEGKKNLTSPNKLPWLSLKHPKNLFSSNKSGVLIPVKHIKLHHQSQDWFKRIKYNENACQVKKQLIQNQQNTAVMESTWECA